ncbi:unnamed protein product [Eruca vesicaria subsp. sativa]|uniref:RRM domain-containing protein n=1 Tax=Eruca vesicaria subsp. sativa TaxID=29727 RepID=A0ABC8M9E7_ERUVS|nr:unnamed protein product [Eruca vesicaria subsp. sativa]
MALAFFLSKVGRTFRQASTHVTAPNWMLQRSIRCMSSSSYVKLFVGGISYSTDEFGLGEAFSKYGQVVDAKVVVDRETGRSRGFAFVTFTCNQGATNALMHLDGQYLHGRRIRVKYAFGGGGGYGARAGGYGGRLPLFSFGPLPCGYAQDSPVFYDDPLPCGHVAEYSVWSR